MRPSAFLRSLSLRIPARLAASSAVAPLPLQTEFDHQVSAELDTLQSQKCEYDSASWLVHALEVSSTTQKIALESLSNVMFRDSDRKIIDEYLDGSVEMLDACNHLSEKLDAIQNYVETLKTVSKLLEGKSNPTPSSLIRARDLLVSSETIQRRSSCSRKCSSSGSRKKYLSQNKLGQQESELREILACSEAVATMVCGVLDLSLAFRARSGGCPSTKQLIASYSWSSSLHQMQKGVKECPVMLVELRQAVMAARNLRNRVNKRYQLSLAVEELKRSCGVLEEWIQPLEDRVKLLYKSLISMRMVLLGTLSQGLN